MPGTNKTRLTTNMLILMKSDQLGNKSKAYVSISIPLNYPVSCSICDRFGLYYIFIAKKETLSLISIGTLFVLDIACHLVEHFLSILKPTSQIHYLLISSRLSLCTIYESPYSHFSLFLFVYTTIFDSEFISNSLWSMKMTCTDLLFSRKITACFDLNQRRT